MSTKVNPDCPLHGTKSAMNDKERRRFQENFAADKLYLQGKEDQPIPIPQKVQNGIEAMNKLIDEDPHRLRLTGRLRNGDNTYDIALNFDQNSKQKLEAAIARVFADEIAKAKAELREEIKNGATADNSLDSLRADLLDLSNKIENMRDVISSGKMSMQNSARITQDEFKRLAPARIQTASLSEILDYMNGKAGNTGEQ